MHGTKSWERVMGQGHKKGNVAKAWHYGTRVRGKGMGQGYGTRAWGRSMWQVYGERASGKGMG